MIAKIITDFVVTQSMIKGEKVQWFYLDRKHPFQDLSALAGRRLSVCSPWRESRIEQRRKRF